MLGSFVPVIDHHIRELQSLQRSKPAGSVVSVDYVLDMLLDMRKLADTSVHQEVPR